jgi:hypothetical protein
MKVLKHDVKIDLRLVDLGAAQSHRYQVLHEEEVLAGTAVLAAAEVDYEEQYERLWAERPDVSPRERMRRERAHADIQAVRSGAFQRRAGLARPKGGRGGRGGV